MRKRDEEDEGIALIVAACKLMGWVIAVPRGLDDISYLVVGEEKAVRRVDEILSWNMNPGSGKEASIPKVPR